MAYTPPEGKPPDNQQPLLLAAHHYTMLHEASAIADALIRARGYQSLPQPEDIIDHGFSKAQAKTAPALGIPLWDVHGQRHGWQIRPDCPRQMPGGRVNKYELATGDRLILDVHPSVQPHIADPQQPLWITEGVRKGDALASHGVCTIALVGGVWGFRGSNAHGGKVILPDWDYVGLNGRLIYVVYDSDIYQKPSVDAALKALYRFLRDRGARPGLVRWPEEYRQTKIGVDDYLAQGHTLEEVLAMVPPMGPLPTMPPAQRNGHVLQQRYNPDLLLTDTYNAAAFVDDYGPQLRYCYAWKSWMVWTGSHWQRDTSGEVMRMAKQTVKRLARRAEALDDEQQIAALLAHVKASLSTAKLEALIKNAQSEPGIAVQPDELDSDPWALNVSNGTIDLRTGEIRNHRQADMLTKCLPIAYDREATCPTWKAFLWRIMGGSQGEDSPDMGASELENRRLADARAREMIAYLQRAAGYTLTGSTREQCLFLCHGPTKTGKSTYLATLRALLGPYGKQADMQTFMHKDRPEVRNDLADLAGARYVYAVESQEGKRLAESLVKQITGGVDAMKARFLYEELFEFKPQFKAYLGTNHLPLIKDSDDAIWERIRRIPFIVQIPKDERDKDLEHRLLDEIPGILAWAVQGCLDWQAKNDLQEPAPVLDANQAYRAEMDIVARFLDECCRFHEQFRIKAGDLHTAFLTWCEGTGVPTMTLTEFGKRLDKKGIEKHTSNFVWRLGLTLKDN